VFRKFRVMQDDRKRSKTRINSLVASLNPQTAQVQVASVAASIQRIYSIYSFFTLGRPIYKSKNLTPQSRVLLEKLIVDQPVKNIPAFYGIKTFIILLKRALP